MKIPKPSVKFINARTEYLKPNAATAGPNRNKELRTIMEAEFMKAFRLAPDIRKKAEKLRYRLFPNGGSSQDGLDHCTYYYSLDSAAPAIVTQPYGDWTKQLSETLSLGAWSVPDVVDASDWGFYNPSKANLHIIFFPHSYAEALAGVRRVLTR